MTVTEIETVGENIRRARSAAELTQSELAAHLGVQPVQVSRWERGAQEPPLRTLRKLAAVLGVKVAWLLTRHKP